MWTELLFTTPLLPALFWTVNPKPELPLVQVADAVRRALVLTSMPVKEACARMGITEQEFSRQLNHRGMNLARLMMLGPTFMGHLASSLGVKSDLEKRIERLEAHTRIA